MFQVPPNYHPGLTHGHVKCFEHLWINLTGAKGSPDGSEQGMRCWVWHCDFGDLLGGTSLECGNPTQNMLKPGDAAFLFQNIAKSGWFSCWHTKMINMIHNDPRSVAWPPKKSIPDSTNDGHGQVFAFSVTIPRRLCASGPKPLNGRSRSWPDK